MPNIVIPVYAGEAATRRCIESVLAAPCVTPHRVIVVDDCSPEPALSAWLDELAAQGRIELLRNARNLGFVGSVNRALAVGAEHDIILLNSDTEVAGDWLDRLVRSAAAHPDAATLTPFSNNATICSYPYEGWTGDVPGTLGLAGLDALIAERLPGVVADLPTGVGFCMFIRRDCLLQIGGLDEEAFGRGYGEENDLCRRAAKAGWRNLLCADVFVFHQGSVSFGEGRFELMWAGARTLHRLHPEYDGLVRRFIAADSLRPLRDAIDAARRAVGPAEAESVAAEQAGAPLQGPAGLSACDVELSGFNCMNAAAVSDATRWMQSGRHGVRSPAYLHVTHSWGGGVERWVQDMVAADRVGRPLVLRSRSARNSAGVRLELIDASAGNEVLLAWDLVEPIEYCAVAHSQYKAILGEVLEGFRVEAVIVSSLIGHSLDVFDQSLPTVLVLHDLFPFCPALFGCFGEACTRCDRTRLGDCFTHNPHNVFWHHPDVEGWQRLRDAYGKAIVRSNVSIAAPSRSVLERYAGLFPVLRSLPGGVIPHGLHEPPARHWHRRLRSDGARAKRLRVLVPGRLSPHKGLALLRALMPALAEFADVLLLGCGDFGRVFAQWDHVSVLPDYSRVQMPALVAAFDPDCALLCSTLPETFSYTLSEMQALGIPVVATALGAFAERIQDGRDGFLVMPSAPAIAARLRALAAGPGRLAEVAQILRTLPVRDAGQMLEDYRDRIGTRRVVSMPEASDPVVRMNVLLSRALVDARARLCRAQVIRQREGDAAWRQSAHLSWQVGELEAQLGSRDAEILALRRRLQDLEHERTAIFASKSWTLTAPLRALATRLGRGGAAAAGPVEALPRSLMRALRVFEQDDCVSRRRMRLLAERLGDAEEGVRREQVDLLPGSASRPGCFAGWSTQVLGGDVICLTSLLDEDLQQAMSVRPVDRFVVPTSSIARAAREAVGRYWGSAQGMSAPEIVQVAYPLVGDWLGVWAVESEASLRARQECRGVIGVPDNTRIVLGVGRGDGRSGLAEFAQAALHTGEEVNGTVFVWLGALDLAWAADQGERLSLPIALRRLFILDSEDFERWMRAADLYLGCRHRLSSDSGAVEALACGLALAVLDPATVPDDLMGRVQALEVGSTAVVEWLTHAHKAFPSPDEALLARYGGPCAWAAFAEACACVPHRTGGVRPDSVVGPM